MSMTVSWMWGDATTGYLSHLNPMRWSQRMDLQKIISELKDTGNVARPVCLQLWETKSSAAVWHDYPTVAEAIAALEVLSGDVQMPNANGTIPSVTRAGEEEGTESRTHNAICSIGYASLDAQRMELPELARLGRLLVEQKDFAECGLYALPRKAQQIQPTSWLFEKLRSCASFMVSGRAEAASEGLIQIAVRAIHGLTSERKIAGTQEARLAGEVVTSLLLNLGGQLEASEEMSDRLKCFIALGLKRYNEQQQEEESETLTWARNVLLESARYNLSVVASALAYVFGREGAAEMLFLSIPPEAPPLAPGQKNKLREIISAMVASLSRVTSTMSEEMTDAEAIRHMRHISRRILLATAVLTMNDTVGWTDTTVTLAAAWMKTFFSTCVGVAPEALNEQRMRSFLEGGKDPSIVGDVVPHERLNEMGACRLPAGLGNGVAFAILARLLEAQNDHEDELFTACCLVDDNGRLVQGLDAVVIEETNGQYYTFLYDRESLAHWRQERGTLPETRHSLVAPNVVTLQLS